MATTFTLSPVEHERAERFWERHLKLHEGMKFEVHYRFTPTGIGDAITMKCGLCKKTRNITEYEAW